jgi:hypothetical protein
MSRSFYHEEYREMADWNGIFMMALIESNMREEEILDSV